MEKHLTTMKKNGIEVETINTEYNNNNNPNNNNENIENY